MSTHRKRWSVSEKLAIINYAKKNGAVQAAREYNVSSGSVYKWISLHEEEGEEGLRSKRNSGTSVESEELRRLRRENQQLKELVAEKELRLRIKDALLKKSQ